MNVVIRLFLLFIPCLASAQSDYTKRALHLDIGYIVTNSPSSDEERHFQSVALYSSLYFIHSKTLFDSLQTILVQNLEYWTSNNKLGLLALEKTYWAFINLKYNNLFTAVWSLKQANTLAQQNIEKDYYAKAASGLINIALGSVPNNKKWMLSILGLNGTIERGLELLSQVETHKTLNFESFYINAAIKAFLLDEDETMVYRRNETFNLGKLILQFLTLKMNYSGYYFSNLPSIIQNGSSELQYLDHYIQAKHELQRGNYTESIRLAERFHKEHQGENYVKDAILVQYMACLLSSNSCDNYLSEMRDMGSTLTMVDRYAQHVATMEELLNPAILEIRLKIDGGFYYDAQSLFDTTNMSDFTPRDSVEYHYRGARLYGHLEKNEEAYQQYKKVIETQGSQQFYYAPKSLLELAKLEFGKRNEELALEYLSKINKYDLYTYQSEIEAEANLLTNQINTQYE